MATSHDKSTRWLVFGDSIVSGFFDTCGGWVDRLKHDQMMKFIRDGAGVKVFNLGISGQTSRDLLARIEGELAARLSPRGNCVVVISIGGNDSALEDGTARIDISVFQDTMQKIIAIAKRYTKRIVVVGLLPVDEQRTRPVAWGRNLSFTNERLMDFDRTLQLVAQREGATFVSLATLFGDNASQFLYDGVHPNDEGHKIIYNRMRKELDAI